MHNKGFTLIELMITVAIVAILASIAYPSYTNYIRRGKIIDATASLSQYRVQMEQYFQDNRNYGTGGAACTPTLPASDYFTFSCTVNSTTSFTASASSKAGGVSPTANDYVYEINESNAKSTTKFNGASVTKSCWLVKGSEC